MKICSCGDFGACINCDKVKTLAECGCDACRKDAEKRLELLERLLETELTITQKKVVEEWKSGLYG